MAGSVSGWFRTPDRGEQLRAAGVREDLVLAAERTPFSRHSDSMLTALPALLTDDETVVDLVEGRRGKLVGLCVLTSRRVLYVPKSSQGGAAVTLDRADVLNAACYVHRGMSSLTLSLADGDLVVDQILGNQAEAFAAHLLVPGPEDPRSEPRDPIEELIELRLMHRAGTVSDAEFQLRKQQLFDRI